MKKTLLTFSLILLINLCFAQKIERAINALDENKADKAIELFEELIKKDNLDIAAIIGLSKARDLRNPSRDNKIELNETIDMLIKAAPVYDKLTPSDKMFFNLRLKIINRGYINLIIKNLLDELWLKHLVNTNSINEVESYISNYSNYYSINLTSTITEKLIDLNYSKAKTANTIQYYQRFLYSYPVSKYTEIVMTEIDNLTFKIASESNNILVLENYIKSHKTSSNYGSASEQLLILYLNSLGDMKDPKLIESFLVKIELLKNTTIVQNTRSKLESALANLYFNNTIKSSDLNELESLKIKLLDLKYADSVNLKIQLINEKIYKLEFNNITTNNNHLDINEFLLKYEHLSNTHLSIYDRRDSLWFLSLGVFSPNKINEYADFFKTATFNNTYTPLLENVKNYWINKVIVEISKTFDDFLKSENSNLSSIENIKNIITSSNNLITVNLDIDYVLYFLKTKKEKKLLNQLLNDNRIIGNILFYDYNSYSNIVTTYTLNNGLINKKIYFLKNNLLYQSPDFSSNHQIFNAIKTRYGIVKFTNLTIDEFNATNDEFKVNLYGYTEMNLKAGTCCPSYKIQVLFTRVGNGYIPKTALSISNNYSSIEGEVNLNYLTKFDIVEIVKKQISSSRSEDYDKEVENDEGEQVTTSNVAVEAQKAEEYDQIYTNVQIPAEFPGGQSGWVRYLERTLNRDLPVENGAPFGKYTVFVSFIVDKEGNVSNVKADNNPGYGTKEEAERVISRGPKWKPAQQNGRNVLYRHFLSIDFKVVQD